MSRSVMFDCDVGTCQLTETWQVDNVPARLQGYKLLDYLNAKLTAGEAHFVAQRTDHEEDRSILGDSILEVEIPS